jgi:HEAT repeat protein
MDPSEIPFQKVLDALLDADTTLAPSYLYRLSDLDGPNLDRLKKIWPQIPTWRRQAMMEDVEELSRSDTLLYFPVLACLAARDEDPKVRLHAVRTLWDYEEDYQVALLLDILNQDDDAQVRDAAAAALGHFIFLGEIEELSQDKLKQIEDTLLAVVNGTDAEHVRQTALEALGFSSRAELPALIEAAYDSGDNDWIASALFAMGRSANEIWQDKVLAMLDHIRPKVRCEAARAAGELEISKATPQLLELLDDPDDNTRLASIWSLSQIGGVSAQETLEELYELTEDENELAFIEDAIDYLLFNQQSRLLPFFDFPDQDFDDLVADFDDDFEEFDYYPFEEDQE